MRYFVFILLPVLLTAGNLLQVRDLLTMRPLPDVRVISGRDTLVSDDNGIVNLGGKSTVTWPLLLQKEGYFPARLTKPLRRPSVAYLMPQLTTEEITVVGSRPARQPLSLPANFSFIDVRQRASGLESAAELLARQEGLIIKSYGGSGQLNTISVRGMSAEQTQVSFDGVPVNNLQLGSVDLGKYDSFGLEGISVYRGGNALFGGNGSIGGVVSIIPDSIRDRLFVHAGGAVGSYGNRSYRFRLDFPAGRLQNSLQVFGADAVNDYPATKQARDGRLRNRDFSRRRFAYRNRLLLGHGWQAQTGWYAFKHAGGSPRPFTDAAGEAQNRARLDRDESLVTVKLLRSFAAGRFKLHLFQRNEWMEYHDPALLINYRPLHSTHFNRQQGAIASVYYQPASAVQLRAGLEGYREKIRSSEAGNHARSHEAFFAVADWRVFDRPDDFVSALHINASLRAVRYSGRPVQWLPAAGFSLQSKAGRFYGAIGKNYRAPGFNDLYWVPGGNPNLKPEYADHAEIGHGFTRAFSFLLVNGNGTFYYNRVRDLIKWQPDGSLWRPVNIGAVESKGVELRVALSDLRDRYRLRFNYTYGQSRKSEPEFPGDRTVGNQLPYLPRETLHFSARVRLAGWRLGFQLSRESFRYLTIANDERQVLPGFTVMSLNVRRNFRFGMMLLRTGFSVSNLLDVRYQTIPGYPMPPRMFALTIDVSNEQNNHK